MSKTPHWPDERVHELQKLRADPTVSASDAAKALGVSRSAVLGKEKRLRDAGKPAKAKAKRAAPPRESSRMRALLDIKFARSQR